jgi:hypothetical protein
MNKLITAFFSHRELILESRKENPHVKSGFRLLKISSLFMVGGILFILKFECGGFKFDLQIDSRIGILVLGVGVTVALTGLFLIHKGLSDTKKNWNNRIFYYLKGMDNQTNGLPSDALPKMAKWYPPNPVILNINNDNLDTMYNELLFNHKTITKKVNQYNSQMIFFAGMARVPCLFFIGYAFRNAHSTITLLDHDHQADKWFSLKHTDDTDINTIIESPIFNQNNRVPNISVIIEFTCEIPTCDLPVDLQEHVLRIKITTGYTHNQTTSEKTVGRIVQDIINQLVIINKKCDRLHLFISAQSTITFSIGRRYQDGMMGNITVYNYNGIKKAYTWAISLTDNIMKLEKLDI